MFRCILGSVACMAFYSGTASAQQIRYNEGVITAFRVSPTEYVAHYSPDGRDLADGACVYRGPNPVVAMAPYKGGILTAVLTQTGSRIYFSPNGRHLVDGAERVYDGGAVVTALNPHAGGVLVALCGGGSCRVLFSPDGRNLAEGRVVYAGQAAVVSLAPFRGGVVASFAGVGGRPDLHRVTYSRDSVCLGGGECETLYEGRSPVTFLTPVRGGLMAVFSGCGASKSETRVLLSADGERLGEGEICYTGRSSVCGLIPFRSGVLVAFTRVNDDPAKTRVHLSADGYDVAGGEVVYEGNSVVTAMSQFSAVVNADVAMIGDNLLGWVADKMGMEVKGGKVTGEVEFGGKLKFDPPGINKWINAEIDGRTKLKLELDLVPVSPTQVPTRNGETPRQQFQNMDRMNDALERMSKVSKTG